MKQLTQKQKSILDFIEDFQERQGMPPTVYEIGEHFGVKTSTVFAHLRALQRKDQLSRSSKARSISITHPRSKTGLLGRLSNCLLIPLLGRVNAGVATDSPADNDEMIPVAVTMMKDSVPENLFALRIQGESMRDLGLLEGDVVVVEKDRTARPGDIVVALVNGNENTVKSYFPRRDGKVELRAANPAFSSVVFESAEVGIQGKVIALLRKY